MTVPSALEHAKNTMELPIERSVLLKATLAKINEGRKFPITFLKPKQIQCILSAAADRDVLGILPTGYGKSLIFEAVPIFRGLLHGCQPKTVVISPLNVIIDQQMTTLGKDAFRVHQTGPLACDDLVEMEQTDNTNDEELPDPDTQSPCALKQGNFKFLLGHPEDLLAKDVFEVMRTSKWAKDVSTVVIDEAHCVVQWSMDFRPKYRDIEQLRAIFPSATFVALTATASIRMRSDIVRLLNMKSPDVISAQVDRVNIKYSVMKRPSHSCGVETSYTGIFVPIMNELKAKQDDFPKTVIYTSLKWCGFGNEIGVKTLSSGEITIAGVPEVAQFHAPLSAEAKRQVAERMASREGDLKLLFATEAYGMGVDTRDIRRVIHAGPPCTLETYVQTTGRGGRDGDECDAVLFHNNEDLGKQTLTEEMRCFCRLDSCRRQFLCKYFGTVPAFSDHLHRCCDNCAVNCSCDECLCQNGSEREEVSTKTSHNRYMESDVYQALTQVFSAINSRLNIPMDPQLFTGLTDSLARDIASHYELFLNEDTLMVNYFHLEKEYVKVIFQVLTSCQQ